VIQQWMAAVDADAGSVRKMLAELLPRRSRRSDENFQLQVEALESLLLALHSTMLTDEMTRIYNRRGFLRAGAQLLKALGGGGQGALLLCIDVDKLKAVNDSLGHAAGDELLIRTAQVLRDTCGYGDVLGRLGGDEFAALVRLTDLRSSQILLTRLRDAIDAGNSSHRGATLSLSVGFAEFDPRNPLSMAELLQQADREMYARKLGNTSRARVHANLDSCFNVAKQVCDGMMDRGWGRVINISSAGMHRFTKALAIELARKGVTVNTISPGCLQEVAGPVVYLASEEAAFLAGAHIAINGVQLSHEGNDDEQSIA
jgi:diguanylate cyclase (GGDEF)-like protein